MTVATVMDRTHVKGLGCIFRPHRWGPWGEGTVYETYNGQRTGRTVKSVGRECERCGVREVEVR